MPGLITEAFTSRNAKVIVRGGTITDVMAGQTLVARRMQALVRQLIAEGKSQRAIAKDLGGVSQALVSDYASGTRNASNRTAEKAAKALHISPAFFNDPALGEAPNYHEFKGKRGRGFDGVDVADEPPEFLEWERAVAPFLSPPLQASERKQMIAVRYHRGAVEKYSRLLHDLRDGVSAEDIAAEEHATTEGQAEADAMGVPSRRRR